MTDRPAIARVLLTRPRAQSEALAADLAREGLSSVIWPLIKIETVGFDPARIDDAGALVFTSAAAVNAVGEALSGRARPAFVVGPRTAKAAESAGCAPVIRGAGDGAALLDAIREAGTPGPYLHLRGDVVRTPIAEPLRADRFDASEMVVYRTRAEDSAPDEVAALIGDGEIAVAAFFSPRTAETFAKLATESWRGGLAATRAVAISEAAAAPLRPLGFADIGVAEAPNGDAMRAAICGAAK